jgi:hypothetical protein
MQIAPGHSSATTNYLTIAYIARINLHPDASVKL